jgi:uncharacterized GH25 family protein
MRTTAIALAALLLPALGRAHDLWVERAGGEFTVRYGHRGGELLPIDGAKLKAIRCAEGSGAPKDVRATAQLSPKEVRFAARCDAVAVFHDGGTYSLTPDGEVNLPRTQARDVVKAWESRQFAKWIDARSARASTVLGDELELVPVTDLGGKKDGDKATFKVLSRGQPVPGAVVAVDHKPLGETDSAGEVRLRLRGPVDTIEASVRRALKSPDAEAVVLEASLTFEVSK